MKNHQKPVQRAAKPPHMAGPNGAALAPPATSFSPQVIQGMFTIKDFPRPNFRSSVYTAATMSHNIFADDDLDADSPSLSAINAAVPHRMSWANIRDNTIKFLNGDETETDFYRWTERFIIAGKKDTGILKNIKSSSTSAEEVNFCDYIIDLINKSTAEFEKARYLLAQGKKAGFKDAEIKNRAIHFLNVFNSYYPNVPDLGPHRGTNIQVSSRAHPNMDESGGMSPMTQEVRNMSPGRLSGYPLSPGGTHLVTTSGAFVDTDDIKDKDYDTFKSHGFKNTNAKEQQYDEDTGWK